MNSQNKYNLLVLCILVILGYTSYLGMNYKKEQLSQEVSSDSSIVSSTITPSQKNSSIGFIYSISGSNQSGISMSQNSSEKNLIFKQPNIEWKDKTLSGITYKFGEGNPPEIQTRLDHEYNPQYADGVTVRAKTEKFLTDFLSNPMLEEVINQCSKFIHPRKDVLPGLESNLPEVLFTTDFSMESMITIDPSTGEKVLNREKFDLFGTMLEQIIFPTSEDSNIPWIVHIPCIDESKIEEYKKLVYQYLYANQSWNNSYSIEN